jgi:RNA polymerase sigma-70 factor (ECF subfamily)
MLPLLDILASHTPQLERFALRLCGDPADASDLVQDTFVRALARQEDFLPGSNAGAWLTTILRRLFIDRYRRRVRAPRTLGLDAAGAFEPAEPEPAWASLSIDEVKAALLELDDDFRVVFELHALEGRSYSAIAEQLGLNKVTVGTRLTRARKKLRAVLTARLASQAEEVRAVA